MKEPSLRSGFTLIELMIVIAIIAIIASIAIPGLIASQRASNERNAAASLKTLASAEIDFRGNDRDGNHIQDYWTRDVSGLYGLCPISSDQPIRLIDISISGADSNPQGTAPGLIASDQVINSFFSLPSPKATYWYMALVNDEVGSPYRTATNGIPPFETNEWFHHGKFAVLAYPESYSAGRQIFYLNEVNTLFKRSLTGNVRPVGGTVPPGPTLLAAGASGTAPLDAWPTEIELKLNYSRLD